MIVVLERAASMGDRFVFEPHREGPIPHESKDQRARREAAEAAHEAPRVGGRGRTQDVDLGVPDMAGGWKEVRQMKYIEAHPRSAKPGDKVRSVAERVEDNAFEAAKQIKFADQPQKTAGKTPATKIVEIRAEAPHADLDPAAWRDRFLKNYPADFKVLIYSTFGGDPWTIP